MADTTAKSSGKPSDEEILVPAEVMGADSQKAGDGTTPIKKIERTTAESPGHFTDEETLVLAEVMNRQKAGLSRHLFLRLPITDKKLKKEEWIAITKDFCNGSGKTRTTEALKKKWNNLIESEKDKISNYLFSPCSTGWKPDYEKLSDLTKTVMSAVGVRTPATSMLVSPGASNSTTDRKVYHVEPSATKVLETPRRPFNIDQQVDESLPLASCPSPVNVCCPHCNSQRRVEMLQEEKLTLQIKLLKKELGEE